MPDSFEQLEVWQRSVDLAIKIYKITQYFPKTETFALTDQIKRSVTSISANIAEGTGRYHFKDKKVFMYTARGSLYETRSHLLIAEKLFSLDHELLEPILHDITILSVKLNNFISRIVPQSITT